MKNIFKLFAITLLFVQSSVAYGQIKFTNGGGDKLFSNPLNWEAPDGKNKVPTAADKIKLDTNRDTIIVDGVYNVKQVLATRVGGAIIGNGGSDTLYINGNGGTNAVVQANGADARVAFHVPVVIETTVGTATKSFQLNGNGSHIKFFDALINNSMHLTIANPQNRANTQFLFDGKITSKKWMNINSNVKATFGENSDFTEHNSALRLIGNGNAQLTVQTPKNKFKTAGTKIIVNGGGTLIIDSEDVLGATIQVDTDKTLNLIVNKNQANAGKITMASGKINLTVDAAVTKLNFSDNSESDWGTGEIEVIGFKDKVLSFGSNKNGITSNQIAQINTGAASSYLLWNGQLSSVFEPAPRLAAGDIAFTGLNADGADNLSFVALVDIAAGTNFFITDNEVLTGSGGQFDNLNEGVIKWENTTGDVIPAGTSVVLDSTSNAGILTFSSGTATVETGEINLSTSGDGVFAYQTSTDVYNTGTNSFLAHIVAEEKKSFRNSVNQFVGDSVLNAETGLTYGVNAVNISGGSGSPDGGKHDRGVTAGTKDNLLAEINDYNNWTLESSEGNDILPLSNESYSIYPSERLAAGDIAFTGLNADGADNLSFVVMVDIAVGTNFFLTDNEVDVGTGGKFDNLNEGVIKWENKTDSIIPAGTSVVLDSTSNGGILTASIGTATVQTGEINLSTSGDGVFAFQTSTDVYNTGTNNFLAHIVAEERKSFRSSGSFVEDDVLSAETGLTYGLNAVNISGGSGSPDGGKHDRGVTKGSKEQLLKEINSFENWTLESSEGNDILPLSNESYEITAEAVYVPTLVKLTSTSGSVKEDAGQIPVSIEIINAYPEDSTAVQLVFSGTDSTDFNNFISDTVIFAKGVSTAQSAIIPILNDTEPEGEETFTFTLRNVTGGYQSSIGADSVFTLTVIDDDLADFSFVYNELHIDPASDISGDANGDGTRDPKEDEFIELVNTGSTAFDLSGYYMTDIVEPNLAPRHIFPTGTVVDSGQAIVIFGGGIPTSPTNFGGAVVQTASENNDGVGLANDGNTIYIKNSDGLTVLSQAYDATQGNANQSITRSPDLTGDFISHSGVTAANGALFSPGMKLDSTIFYQHTSTKVQFQVMEVAFKEDNTDTLAVGVTINGASSTNATEVTISLASGGTGTSDDINLLTQTLSFDAGSSETKYVYITTVNDDLQEGNESFMIEISSVSGGDNATIAYPSKFSLTIADDDIDNPLILNEVLTDPPKDDTATPDIVEGDANGDGTRAPFDDEFVELVNTSSSQLDVSGYSIFDNAGLKHSVPENTVLESGQAFVVFGGGSPTGDFGGAVVQTASSGSLTLNNGGDKVTVNDNNGNTIIEFEYGGSTPFDGGARQSLTRDPDITGGFVLHTTTTAGGLYSPGTQIDGSTFDVGTNEPTKVQFAVSEFTLANEDGSYNTGSYEIEVQISNPSPNVATQVEVLFTASDLGSAADIGDYAGEVLTFSSGSADSQVSKVTISSSSIELGTKYDFALQNATGGNLASIGENSTFTLVIGDPGSVPLSVENEKSGVSISPNPTSDFINVKIDKNKVLDKYFVTDMSGAQLQTKAVGRVVDHLRIDARNFDNGLYILGLNFEGESVKLKFIKR